MDPRRRWILLVTSVLAVMLTVFVVVLVREEGSVTGRGEGGEEIGYLTATQLDSLLGVSRFALIEFGGRGCVPCREMQPILVELQRAHGGWLAVANIDLNEVPELGDRYDIMAIPTQIIFDGRSGELSRHLGVWPRQEVEAELQRLEVLP